VSAAIRLFEEHGYHATSVQSIVDDAQLTKGAFYHHFDSKEDVLHELHDQFMDYQLDRLREVIARGNPPDETLKSIVSEVLVEPIGRYKPEITIFLQERRFLSDEAFASIKERRDEFERLVVDVIEQGMKAGVFKRIGPPQLVAFGVIGMGAWPYTWMDPKGSVPPREIGEMFGQLIVDGLRAG
jgi:TetR/AcrR family transcriptional regulator, cholesterol catabolism regulator